MARPTQAMLEKMRSLFEQSGSYVSVGRAIGNDWRFVKRHLSAEEKKEEVSAPERSSQTKGLSLLRQGRSILDVVIELGLTPEQGEQLQQGFWRLHGRQELEAIYEDLGSDALWRLIELHKLVDEKGLDPEYCIGKLQSVHNLENNIFALVSKRDRSKAEVLTLNQDLVHLRTERDKAKRELETLLQEARKSSNELSAYTVKKSALAKEVAELHSIIVQAKNDAAYLKLVDDVESKVNDLLGASEMIPTAIVSCLKALRGLDDLDKYAMLYGTDSLVTQELALRKGFPDVETYTAAMEERMQGIGSRIYETTVSRLSQSVVTVTLNDAQASVADRAP